MGIEELLYKLKNKLEEEKEELLKLDNPDRLLKVIDEKKEILRQLSEFDKEDFKDYIEIIEEIEKLSKRNLSLALNNMNMIDEIFSTIFEEETVKQYSPYGEQKSQPKSGILNKKI